MPTFAENIPQGAENIPLFARLLYYAKARLRRSELL